MTQPESKLSRDFQNHIRTYGGFCFKVHGGPMTMAGVPDICAVLNGYSLWIETKVPGGKGPSTIQQLRHTQIVAAGGHVAVLRSMAALKDWLGPYVSGLAPRNTGSLHTEGTHGTRR